MNVLIKFSWLNFCSRLVTQITSTKIIIVLFQIDVNQLNLVQVELNNFWQELIWRLAYIRCDISRVGVPKSWRVSLWCIWGSFNEIIKGLVLIRSYFWKGREEKLRFYLDVVWKCILFPVYICPTICKLLKRNKLCNTDRWWSKIYF